MEDMFTKLNLAIEDLTTRMDGRDMRRNHDLPHTKRRRNDVESCGDNSEGLKREY